jgi:hypothetical protein
MRIRAARDKGYAFGARMARSNPHRLIMSQNPSTSAADALKSATSETRINEAPMALRSE